MTDPKKQKRKITGPFRIEWLHIGVHGLKFGCIGVILSTPVLCVANKEKSNYSKLNEQFVGGNKFYINNNEHNVYVFHVGDKDGKKGCIANADTGLYVCNVKYVGRTKVEGFTYVLDKFVNVKINLKEVTFIK